MPDKKKREELREIKDLLNQIRDQYNELNATSPFDSKKAQDYIGNIDELKNGLREARDAVNDLNDGASDIYKSWQSIVNEVSTSNSSYRKGLSELDKITKISKEIKDHNNGINTLSSKQLKKKKEQLESSRSELKSQVELLSIELKSLGTSSKDIAKRQKILTLIDNINGALDEQNGLYSEQLKVTDKQIDKQEDVEKSMGIMGGIMKGMSQIKFLSGLIDSDKILKDTENKIKSMSDAGPWEKGWAGVTTMLGGIRSQLIDGILNPSNLISGAMVQMGKALLGTDKAAGDLAKSMNITYSEALNTRSELTGIANSSMDTAVNTRGLQETMMAVNAATGARVNLNEKDLVTFTKLREQAGMTNDEIMGLQQVATLNNQTLDKTNEKLLGSVKSYAAKNKMAVNEKQIMKDVSKMSASLKLSLGGSVEKMAEAALKAKQFGLNLEQAQSISAGLLNFEQSIEDELSAELITGKSLNLEKARSLALSGDTAAAAAEVAKQVGSAAEFGRMNVIQQEAMAKAVGMSKDDLAQSLIDKEALTKLGVKDAKNAQDAYNQLKAQGMSEAEIQKRLGETAKTDMFEQQSMQEQFNQTVEKLQEIFMGVANILMPIFDIFSGIFDIVGWVVGGLGEWGTYLIGIMGTMKIISIYGKQSLAHQLAQNTATLLGNNLKTAGNAIAKAGKAIAKSELVINIGKAAMGAIQSLASIPVIGWALGLAAAGTVAALGYSFMKGNDIMSPGGSGNGYGNRTLFGPEGAIQLNNKDTVIAGTNLFGDDTVSEPGKATEFKKEGEIKIDPNNKTPQQNSPSVNMEPTNALLRQLISVIQAGGTVTLDGQKVGEALSLGAYKTQ